MGRSGMKRKGRQHLPKAGTAPANKQLQHAERRAIEEQMGIRPGSPMAWILGGIAVVLVVIAIVALIALD